MVRPVSKSVNGYIPREITDRLPNVKLTADGCGRFCCPIHGDEHASAVAFPPNQKGFVNLYCSAGCDPWAIAAALGITSKMLGGHGGDSMPRTTFGPNRPQFQ